MTTEPQDETHDESVAKVAKLIAEMQVCMFTTQAGGRMVSRPMAVLKTEFDGELWFVTREDARKVDQLRAASQVNVGFASRSSWVSIAGEAEVVRDVGKTKRLWGPGVSAWFPEGPEDSGIVLVRVRGESAEYWDTPGAITASLLSLVKARVTGRPYDVDNEDVRL